MVLSATCLGLSHMVRYSSAKVGQVFSGSACFLLPSCICAAMKVCQIWLDTSNTSAMLWATCWPCSVRVLVSASLSSPIGSPFVRTAPCDAVAAPILQPGSVLAQRERQAMLRRLFPLLLAAVLGVPAACAPPPEAPIRAVSEAARSAPPPLLAETARFRHSARRAGPRPSAVRLEARGRRRSSARAEALRARAAALGDPVLPGGRARRPPRGRRFPDPEEAVGNERRRTAVVVPRQFSNRYGVPEAPPHPSSEDVLVNSIIYLVGLVVIVLAILSFVGLA